MDKAYDDLFKLRHRFVQASAPGWILPGNGIKHGCLCLSTSVCETLDSCAAHRL